MGSSTGSPVAAFPHVSASCSTWDVGVAGGGPVHRDPDPVPSHDRMVDLVGELLRFLPASPALFPILLYRDPLFQQHRVGLSPRQPYFCPEPSPRLLPSSFSPILHPRGSVLKKTHSSWPLQVLGDCGLQLFLQRWKTWSLAKRGEGRQCNPKNRRKWTALQGAQAWSPISGRSRRTRAMAFV